MAIFLNHQNTMPLIISKLDSPCHVCIPTTQITRLSDVLMYAMSSIAKLTLS